MIQYSLKCEAGHQFDSWFQNASAFAALQTANQLSCPVCGAQKIDKDLMAPNVRPARKIDALPAGAPRPATLTEPTTELEQAIATLRKQITENSEYVGMNFAAEARRIHDGDAPERAIHGEAKPEDAKRMIEDGLPVAPLPFLSTRKVN